MIKSVNDNADKNHSRYCYGIRSVEKEGEKQNDKEKNRYTKNGLHFGISSYVDILSKQRK